MRDVVFSKEILSVVNNRRKTLSSSAKVTGVRVLLSPLSHVTAKSLTDAFKQMVTGTDLEHIALQIKPLAVKMKCSGCGTIFEIERPAFACTQCGCSSIVVDDNREFLVESMEVEET